MTAVSEGRRIVAEEPDEAEEAAEPSAGRAADARPALAITRDTEPLGDWVR